MDDFFPPAPPPPVSGSYMNTPRKPSSTVVRSSGNCAIDDDYNIPKNVINPALVRDVRESVASCSAAAAAAAASSSAPHHAPPPLPPSHSPTHRPLLLPSASALSARDRAKMQPITISLSPPAEETNGQLVQRELFRFGKEVGGGRDGGHLTGKKTSFLIALLLALVVVLSVIFVVLLFQHAP